MGDGDGSAPRQWSLSRSLDSPPRRATHGTGALESRIRDLPLFAKWWRWWRRRRRRQRTHKQAHTHTPAPAVTKTGHATLDRGGAHPPPSLQYRVSSLFAAPRLATLHTHSRRWKKHGPHGIGKAAPPRPSSRVPILLTCLTPVTPHNNKKHTHTRRRTAINQNKHTDGQWELACVWCVLRTKEKSPIILILVLSWHLVFVTAIGSSTLPPLFYFRLPRPPYCSEHTQAGARAAISST